MSIMVFWSWAKVRTTWSTLCQKSDTIFLQGLEDAFDGNHRSQLQNVIVREHLQTSDGDYDLPGIGYEQRESHRA